MRSFINSIRLRAEWRPALAAAIVRAAALARFGAIAVFVARFGAIAANDAAANVPMTLCPCPCRRQ